MEMTPNPSSIPSFSHGRKWLSGLNLLVSLAALFAVVLMVNYLAARHFKRYSLSQGSRVELSSLTQRILKSVTNEVHVILFFDRNEPLYESVSALLKEYKYANQNISLQTIDYQREPGAAGLIKAKYTLPQHTTKNLVIFEHQGRSKIVHESELSTLDIQPLLRGQSREIRRTHFKGELMFTSALYSLTSAPPLNAYFLQNHGEHPPESDDASYGFSKFTALLRRINVDIAKLDLSGPGEIPSNCSLLVIAGPSTPLLPNEAEKVDQYLNSGGRLLILFNYFGIGRNTGLVRIMDQWGVQVGDNLVRDPENTVTREDVLVENFGAHPMLKPLVNSALHLRLPRSVSRKPNAPATAAAPEITELFYTGSQGTILTDIRNGIPYPHPGTDLVTNVCLGVAVEKGRIRDITADRGTTRMVVLGDSSIFSNPFLESAANSDFAALCVNWLLDRSELLAGLGPRPITEYTTTLTATQMTAVRWILLLVMPGAVLFIGMLVWMRRRT